MVTVTSAMVPKVWGDGVRVQVVRWAPVCRAALRAWGQGVGWPQVWRVAAVRAAMSAASCAWWRVARMPVAVIVVMASRQTRPVKAAVQIVADPLSGVGSGWCR